MQILKGIMVSPGIAMAPAYLHFPDVLNIPSYEISPGQISYELERFDAARRKAVQDVQRLLDRGEPRVAEEERKLLDTHRLMLEDAEFVAQVEAELKSRRRNVEWVLSQLVESAAAKLEGSDSDYLRERGADVHDVFNRIVAHLLHRGEARRLELSRPCVVVAHNLLPSELMLMDRSKLAGVATDFGGKTSHVAILARSLEIPAVMGLSEITGFVANDQPLIVDGNRGVVIVDPDEATLREYRGSQEAWRKREQELADLKALPAETRDGKRVRLEANIEVPEEMPSVLAHGADGIGLFRSEFLYIVPKRFPNEEEQLAAYTRVLTAMPERSVIIRTLDLGGDKIIPGVTPKGESNPILGWRAVRFCLSRPEIFKTQLRALLRASVCGNLKIMFPMISGVEELSSALEVLEEVKAELRGEGRAFDEEVPVGIMIEVPSAAFTCDILAQKVSFFSIGTNDLIQYLIAVDRENERIAYLYEPFHPGVLRLLKMVIDSAHAAGIPVGMCGEMAGDPYAAVVLLGLGLDEYSMSSIGIPAIKRIIRSVTIAEAEDLVGAVMEMKSFQEIDGHVRAWMEERFDFLAQY